MFPNNLFVQFWDRCFVSDKIWKPLDTWCMKITQKYQQMNWSISIVIQQLKTVKRFHGWSFSEWRKHGRLLFWNRLMLYGFFIFSGLVFSWTVNSVWSWTDWLCECIYFCWLAIPDYPFDCTPDNAKIDTVKWEFEENNMNGRRGFCHKGCWI